jgi:hypothetical protein
VTDPTDAEYRARADMYRLLTAFPGPPKEYSIALDSALADPGLRDILNSVVAVAFGAYILKYGDPAQAIAVIEREHLAAEDLASLGDADDNAE